MAHTMAIEEEDVMAIEMVIIEVMEVIITMGKPIEVIEMVVVEENQEIRNVRCIINEVKIVILVE